MSSYLEESDSDDEAPKKDESTFSKDDIAEVILENDRLKAEGNSLFSRGQYDDSIIPYTKAIENLKKFRLVRNPILHLNRSAAYIAVKNHVKALHDANIAAELDPTNWKAHWRKGISLLSLSPRLFRTKLAIQALESCIRCESLPKEKIPEIERELTKARIRLEQQEAEAPPADLSKCAPS